jgi:hypothetical protein
MVLVPALRRSALQFWRPDADDALAEMTDAIVANHHLPVEGT